MRCVGRQIDVRAVLDVEAHREEILSGTPQRDLYHHQVMCYIVD
jgi:hypothetical protein